jgi:hypothetical protein
MGDQCRLNAAWLLVGAIAVNAAVGCSRSDIDEQRRRLLQTEPRTRARNERIDAHRVLSPEGDLLPSETKVAGVVLPRGFDLKFQDPHAWTYDGHFVPAKVQAYFEKRVTTARVTKKPLGDVEYLGVREKSDPNMTAVLVRVSPAPAKPEWTRIYVGEPVPPEPATAKLMDEQALQEMMAERRKNAR